jgi:hypothetical protein
MTDTQSSPENIDRLRLIALAAIGDRRPKLGARIKSASIQGAVSDKPGDGIDSR